MTDDERVKARRAPLMPQTPRLRETYIRIFFQSLRRLSTGGIHGLPLAEKYETINDLTWDQWEVICLGETAGGDEVQRLRERVENLLDQNKVVVDQNAAFLQKLAAQTTINGVPLRAYLAAHAQPLPYDALQEVKDMLAGYPTPDPGTLSIENRRHRADADAAWKVMQADALLRALEGGA